MWLFSILNSLSPSSPHTRTRRRPSPRRRPAACPLTLEVLDDRILPSFLTPVSYLTGSGPQAVVVADVNGDGKLDLAVVNYGSNTVSVLLGNPVGLGNADGTFQPAQNFATGTAPLSVAVGDFNADGKLDLATANAYDVSVLLGNGDGA